MKLLVLAALGGPLAAEFRYFYGCGRYVGAKARYGNVTRYPNTRLYVANVEINKIKWLFY